MMFRASLLLVAGIVAASSGAQAPLTVDPAFRFYYTPALMDYWETTLAVGWQPAVSDILLRSNGQRLITGGNLNMPNEIPWGDNRSVLVNGEGSVEGYLNSLGGHVIEIPATMQYFSGNHRLNYDCTPDHTFGWAGFAINNPSIPSWQIFEDRSGLVAGYFKIHDPDTVRYVLVKVDQWGQWDSTYTPRRAAGGNLFGNTLFPLQNGQYIFNGSWTSYEGRPASAIIRIHPDGMQDTTFNSPSYSATVATMHEQADGKVVLGGQFRFYDYPDTVNLIRLNRDGSLDLSFNNFNTYRKEIPPPYNAMFAGINVVAPLDETRYVVGGEFTLVDGEARGCIACVDTAGNLLDCWADGGLVPSYYSPSGYPFVGLYGFKRLANGETYIFGKYQGFIDANGLHPEQVLISRLYMPNVGVDERPAIVEMLRVCPNPGTDRMQLSWAGKRIDAVLIRSTLGKVALETHMSGAPTVIDLSSLAPGMYTVEATSTDGVRSTVKWLKQ